jgi:hypothetical protein
VKFLRERRISCYLTRCRPYFTQQTGVLTRGVILREIRQCAGTLGEGRSWTEEFRRALAKEDLALSTVRAYRSDLEIFLRWYCQGLESSRP